MNKKGFTLIELLAVIVILAIIALIAVPSVLNIIEDSRKGAAEASARNIVSAAKTYYMSETMNGRTVDSIDLSGDTLKYDGDQASKGSITFENGKASGKMYVGGYCVEVSVDGNVSSEKMNEDECTIESTPVTTISYADGTPFLYDPVNNVKCSDTQVETNVNNFKSTNSNSITGLKDGCMKWYAFLTDENSETVNLILDHNTTAYFVWGNSGEITTTAIDAQIKTDATNWNENVKNTARLISAEEVNRIAPSTGDTVFDERNGNTWYYLHTGLTGYGNYYEGPVGTNRFAWLLDNTRNCEKYGCNIEDSGAYGYWTSTTYGNYPWRIYYIGEFSGAPAYQDSHGIRPVITVSKDVFK